MFLQNKRTLRFLNGKNSQSSQRDNSKSMLHITVQNFSIKTKPTESEDTLETIKKANPGTSETSSRSKKNAMKLLKII